MTETTTQFKKQLPRNALMAVLSFFTYSLSAIWLTPYLVTHLGAAAYGLIPIAGLLTQYVSIVTAQISAAIGRFLVVEINKPDGDPNTIFNSAFVLYLILIVIQIPLFTLGIIYADKIFSIPQELKVDALLLIGCSAGSFLASLLGAVFGVSIFSANRIDIGSGLDLGRLVARLLLIILCFTMWGAKLRYIGYVDLSLNLVMLPALIYFWRKLTPELSISFREFNWRVLWPMFHMSFWSLINQLGGVLFLRMDIWIINRFISPVAAGAYAAVIVVSNFVRQLGRLATGQLAPVIMRCWAKEEFGELQRLLLFAIKFLSVGLAIPAALISFNADQLLSIWLGENYAAQSSVLVALCIHLPVTVAMLPLFQIQTASNSIKLPALVAFSMGVLNVAMSYLLGVTFEMGALGVAIATAIVLTFRNTFFTSIYGAHLVRLPAYMFMRPLFYGVLMFVFVWLLSMIPLVQILGLDGRDFKGLLLKSVPVALLAGAMGWIFFASRSDRRLLAGMLPERFRGLFLKCR